MIQQEFRLTNPSGLHTRPGNDFVKTAKQYSCDITLTKGDKSADGKSLLKLMKLDIVQGDTINICCSGSDEAEALSVLGGYITSLKE